MSFKNNSDRINKDVAAVDMTLQNYKTLISIHNQRKQ